MRTVALTVAACASLAACAATTDGTAPIVRGAGECTTEPAQRLVGSKATGETGAELLRLTGARTLRWVPPRTAVTMDFRADRLTVSYDDDMIITRISCT